MFAPLIEYERLFDRVPLVSVDPLAQLELREPPVSLETLVLPVQLDPRWVMQHIYFHRLPFRDGRDIYVDLILPLQGVTGSPGSSGPDGKTGPAVSCVPYSIVF